MFPAVIKKYGNRRLYDTEDSRYITLDELASKIQGGRDVRVVDAKNGDDLTQATLTQIIIEGRGAARLLPVGLLARLIRLSQDELAEFLGHHLGTALDAYRRGHGAQDPAGDSLAPPHPLEPDSALARMFMAPVGWASEPVGVTGPAEAPPVAARPAPPSESEVAALRRELDELKRSMDRGRRRR